MRTFWRRVSLNGNDFKHARASRGGTKGFPAILAHGSLASDASEAGAPRAAPAAPRSVAKIAKREARGDILAKDDGET